MAASTGTVEKMASLIGSLDHLEGKTVAILADGNVLVQKVVTSNQIHLGGFYAKAHIGIPFVSDMETLNIEVPLADGTLQGRKVKISQLAIRLINSRGGYIGPDENTLHPITYGARVTGGDTLALISDEIKENLGSGFTDGGRIFLRQADPLPMTVTTLIPSLTPGGVTGL